MADKLTPQQEAAVRNRGGKLLVSAAAGSGKTKVLVDRLLSYLTDPIHPANLDEFLIITYTKAAATELRGKIAEKLTERIALDPENAHLQRQTQRLYLAKISTVHGFCGDILREYAYKLDIPADFRVADEHECIQLRQEVLQRLLDDCYTQAGDDPDFRAFVDTQGLGRDDRLVPEIIQKVYDSARCHLDPEGWLDCCINFTEIGSLTDAGETVWGKFLLDDLKSYLDKQIAVMRVCADQVSREPGMGKPAANLMDTIHQLQTLRDSRSWDDVVRRKNVDFGRLTFPRKDVDQELIERVKAVRTACRKGIERKTRNFSGSSEQILKDLSASAAATRGLICLVRRFSKSYQTTKRSKRVLDFGDLEHRTLDLLLGKTRSGITSAAREIGSRYREIMVDEYQDSNGVQDAIFSALTDARRNCFLVGDVKQSIYQFRLADPGIFLEKYHRYVPAASASGDEGRKILLSHNFRSGAEVIEAVNAVFTNCMRPQVGGIAYTEEESLREGIPHIPLGEPGVELYAVDVQEDTYPEEAAFVAEKIRNMLHRGVRVRGKDGLVPVKPEDIVILLRSPNSVGSYYQQALEARGIRCSSGGGTDLLQTREIGTLRSLLRVVLNPRQDIPLVSTLASPLFGFTADDLAALRGGNKRESMYDALLRWENPKADKFLKILNTLRIQAGRKTLTQLLEQCFLLTRMDSIYAAMPGGNSRCANLREFFRLASDYENGNSRDLSQFLEHLDSREEKGLVTETAGAGGAVTIMSIHKSKGLEFPVVFLCGLSREFNTESQRAQILCDQELGLGMSVTDIGARIRYPSISKQAICMKTAAQGVSEEMRILYVAMTRARDRLIMTYASQSLKKDLTQIALRKDFDQGELLCLDARCPGDWVLLTAMGRTEAGALHQLTECTLQSRVSEYPWLIRVETAPETEVTLFAPCEQIAKIPEGTLERIESALRFRYPYESATHTPSKQTATSRKGRVKDEEAAQDTAPTVHREKVWRKPAFVSASAGGKAFGNAVHKAMQYLPFRKCTGQEAIEQELERLVERGLLTREEAKCVSSDRLVAFFRSELGRKLVTGVQCVREFKFSILDSAEQYGTNLEGERVLLQGVVDCAILEDDGITILDFKSDAVTEQTLPAAVRNYTEQILTYSEALQRIVEKPIKKRLLYFFRLNRFVEVS